MFRLVSDVLGFPLGVISFNCDAGLALGDLGKSNWLILRKKGELTIITCEMFSVFGFLKVSWMKYLSPISQVPHLT